MTSKRIPKRKVWFLRWRTRVAATLLIVMSLTSGCFLDHEVEPYYGRAVTPRAQEFRWSDGGLPQVFDPALAAVPPDTDAVRAMFEGLTEYDPKSLAPVPGVALRWESAADNREWTFYLRHDARWSNNDPVTAQDFVRSWQRTLLLGERAPHARLLKNIQGAVPVEVIQPTPQPSPEAQAQAPRESAGKEEAKKEAKIEPAPQPKFGAEAIDDYTLRIRLLQPDPNFPALVSHPVFRPIHKPDEASANSETVVVTPRLVSNGAFQLSKVAGDGVVLERAKSYWDAQAVALQRVQFVPTQDAESALASYRAGEVDAVTNAGFEPLALKLLAPYKDFRRATFGALTYYSFNTARPPFNDARVREALAIAIDRDRISEDELGGATEPAKKFLPAQMTPASDADHAQAPLIERDVERARKLLAEAGYSDGKNFPKIRLLVNRNAQQRQVAEAVAAMWRSSLNIETEIIQRDWNEYEAAFRSGDYDVARRSYVMQTADETSSLREMLEPDSAPAITTAQSAEQSAMTIEKNGKESADEVKKGNEKQVNAPTAATLPSLSEAQAVKELHAMPIYFASSYALVKPYVVGFETNLLDAPSLKQVRIDTSWQQPKQAAIMWFKSGE
ncbi:MAG TPA: peptide ABC transporter substrate-binding protein [Pyrinomonadaceae bacterium]|nr:peptide ABC transporter substrate-binding protein [Pyrinomonadaceae bacterium]